MSAMIRRAPLRAATGAYILSSGYDKLKAGDEHAKGLHGFASGAYPFLDKVDPKLFTRGLGVAECGLGAALLLPFVSPFVAGAGLIAFSGGLLGLYWRTPGMHRGPNDPRPTQDGMAIAKDAWMLGIGTDLVLDSVTDAVGSRSRKVGRQSRRIGYKARARAAVPAAKASGYLNAVKDVSKKATHVLT
jgi:uncharacterized membrane protein YphA (DoxX/SURF4 family)